jgi:hypothetical protein
LPTHLGLFVSLLSSFLFRLSRAHVGLYTRGCSAVLTLCVDPFGVQVGQGRLVAELLQRLGRLLVDKTTATSPPGLLCIQGHVGFRGGAGSVGPRVASEAQAGGAVEEYG